VKGLGLLPIQTTMQPSKVTMNGEGRVASRTIFGQPIDSVALRGYEIHVGETSYLENAQPFAYLVRKAGGQNESVTDGCVSPDSRIFGTYLHGLFDGDDFRHVFIQAARAFHHLAPAASLNNWERKRQESLCRLARVVSESLDMAAIFEWIGLKYRPGYQAGYQPAPLQETAERIR
jgi:adenosylcobyric acid synthase